VLPAGTAALTSFEPLARSLTMAVTKFGRVASLVTFGKRSTAPVSGSVIVRLYARLSPAGTSWSTSTISWLAHVPELRAVITSSLVGAAAALLAVTDPATAPTFGTRTTIASVPPLSKYCDTQ
jgi:hypothetical protein